MAYDKVVDSSVLDAGLLQIANAIREKGGTSAGLTFPGGMAAAVAAIEAGGGLPGGFSALASGTVTLSSAAYGHVIAHGLGVTPNFFFAIAEGAVTTANNSGYLIVHFACRQPIESYPAHYVNMSVTSAGINSASPGVIKESDLDSYFNAENINVYGFLKAGITYRWVAGVMDGIG